MVEVGMPVVARGFEIAVATPCSESWEAMSRGRATGTRDCELCRKPVHDLAAMTPGQVELLAMRAAAGDAVCGRVTRRADGGLVMLEESARAGRASGVLLSAAMVAGMPVAAQVVREAQPVAGVSEEAALPKSGSDGKSAVITGTLRKPDGEPVESGLVYLETQGYMSGLYVVDDRGRFEMRVAPGVYNFVVQTGEKEGAHVSAVALHAGEQSFGELRTVVGDAALAELNETTVTVGEVSSISKWSWKGRFRHPLLYARSMARGRF